MQKTLSEKYFMPRSNYNVENVPLRIEHYDVGYSIASCNLQYHDVFEVGMCLEGRGVYFIGNECVPFSEGDIAPMRAGDIHFAQSTNENPSSWVFLFFDPESFGISDMPESAVFRDGSCFSSLVSMTEEVEKKTAGYEKRTALLLKYFMSRAANINPVRDSFRPGADKFDRVIPAINYISRNFKKEIKISVLAQECGFAADYFRRVFIASVGKTPIEYITELRITSAEQLLLSTDKPILEISLETGFNTLSSFNRYFKAKNGVSPRIFRSWRK